MDLLLDQGLPRDAAKLLRALNVNCTHVGEIGMAEAADIDILNWARIHDAVIVTLDADFHTMLAVNGMTKPSVIRIRRQGLSAPLLVDPLHEAIKRYSGELKSGCMLTVKTHKTTCRLLS